MMRRNAFMIVSVAFVLLALLPQGAADEPDFSMTYSVPSTSLEMIFDGTQTAVHVSSGSLDPWIYWYDNGVEGMRNRRSFTTFDLSCVPAEGTITEAKIIIKTYLFRLDQRMGTFVVGIDALDYDGGELLPDTDLSDGDSSLFDVEGDAIGTFTVTPSVATPFEYNVTSLTKAAAETEGQMLLIRCSKQTADTDVALYQEVKFQIQLELTYSVAIDEQSGFLHHIASYCLGIAQEEWDCVVSPTVETDEMARWYWGQARFHLNNAANKIAPTYTIRQVQMALHYMALLEEFTGSLCPE